MSGDSPKASGVAGRYATALIDLADEQGALDQVASHLNTLAQALDTNDDLMRLVRSPVFRADDQIRAIDAVMSALGISGLAANFVKLMAKNRRLFALRDTIEAFKALLAERRGEISATVTSAQPLSEAQLGEVRDMLSASAGRNVQLETAVDPSLLGGLIVKMGSRMIDNSLRTKLNSLRTVMKEAG